MQAALLGPRGAAGRVVLSSILAGGICGGGLLVGVLAMLDRGNPGLHLLLAPVLFLLGTVLGLAQGFVVVLAGRARGAAGPSALRKGLVGVAASVPLLPLSWLVSSSIAVSTALRAEVRASWVAVSAVGTVVGLSVCVWATLECWRMVRGSPRPGAAVAEDSAALASPPTDERMDTARL